MNIEPTKNIKIILLIFLIYIFLHINLYSLPVINNISENKDPVGQYEKFELTIDFNANYSNPFDFDTSNGGIDVWAIFTSPQGVTKRVNGFYMDSDGNGSADSWKIRFATGEQGIWSYVVHVKDNTGETNSNTNTFTVTSSTRKGYIRVSNINPRYLVYESGGSFFGIGHNNGWQYTENNCPQCIENPDFSTMANYGENVITFWINSPWILPSGNWEIERSPIENVDTGINNFYQRTCTYIDQKIENAEQNGIKIILCIWSHDNLKTNSGSWDKNAYSTLSNCEDFFDNSSSLSYQEKYYRYIIARWGYSEAILMWDLLVEADLTDGWQVKGESVVNTWLQNTVNYFKSTDIFNHLITASLSGGWDSWDTDPKWPNGYAILDVQQMHSYEYKDDMNLMPRVIARDTQYMWNLHNKPNFIGEFGTANSNNQPVDIHRGAWAGLCSGAAIAPILWCDNGNFINLNSSMLTQQKNLRIFVSDIDFENSITESKSVTVNGYYAYSVGSNDFAICWIFNSAGNIEAGKQLQISSFTPDTYRIKWYDTWNGTYISITESTTTNGEILAEIPVVLYPDIACKIEKADLPTPTPTQTFTQTSTPTQTPTSTPDIKMGVNKKIITPNNDGINDTLYFYSKKKGFFITILSLNGEIVFRKYINDVKFIWDGRSNNKSLLSPGIYIYVVETEDEVKKGTIAVAF